MPRDVKRTGNTGKLILLIIVILLITAVSLFLIMGGTEIVSEKLGVKLPEIISASISPKQVKTEGMVKKEGVYTILVQGLDADNLHTDVIMLVQTDINTDTVKILQIPRDTYAGSNTKYNKKLNEQYLNGKDENMRRMIKNILGIDVDFHLTFTIQGFRDAVDLVEGVEIDVPRDMVYNDNSQNLHINLSKGLQILDGKKAEQFVRNRKGYAMGDTDRVNMQRLFLSAFIKQALKPENIVKVPELMRLFEKNIRTDLSLKDVTYFATQAETFSSENMFVYTAPGAPITKNKASYFSLNKKETVALINEHFNPYETDITAFNIDQIHTEKSITDSSGKQISEIG